MTAFDASPATPRPSTRLAYDDVQSPRELHADCEAVGRALPRRRGPARSAGPLRGRVAGARVEVSETAQRLANSLHLHLD